MNKLQEKQISQVKELESDWAKKLGCSCETCNVEIRCVKPENVMEFIKLHEDHKTNVIWSC